MKKDSEEFAVHFPAIEKLLQTEDFDRINRNFTVAYEALEKVGKGKGGLGKTREARKAMKAIERVMDLFRELLKKKYEALAAEVAPPQPKK